ncbi:MAG: phosphoribosylanthranilate isomerase [Candidatus Omnitrophota bacterium]
MVALKRPLVKICGITSLRDALAAADAGCDALGFIFYRGSPRYITPEKAARIISSLPGKILKVGVFVDAPKAYILRAVKDCALDAVQLHGKEPPEYCAGLKGIKLIKAFGLKLPPDPAVLRQYRGVWAFLFDAYAPKAKGGTGQTFDWDMLFGLKIKNKVFLSGGLHAGNVARAIKKVRPDWVDAGSRLESAPGKKDICKMSAFIAAVTRHK